MHHFDLRDLLEKHQAGVISDEEMETLENWYLQWRPERQQISWDELEALKEDVWQTVSPIPRKKSDQWTRLAAAAAILIIVAAGGYFLSRTVTGKSQFSRKAATDILPGHNQATLTLSNGKKIVLTSGLNGKLAQQGNVAIGVDQSRAITYSKAGQSAATSVSYNTLTTKRGEQSPYPLVLADGTKVWLNASSSITFPTAFTGKQRWVTVTGEAYFEVAHRNDQPFFVNVGKQTIEDLGTHFNINAYEDETTIRTTLLEGAVKVSEGSSAVIIKPGEQARSGVSEGIKVVRVNTENEVSWKNGDFVFSDKDLRSIMRELSRWYDVDVIYDPLAPQDINIDGVISRNRNISAVLKIIELTGKVHFKIEGGKLLVIK